MALNNQPGTSTNRPEQPIPTVFISYSRKDEAEKDALLTHLGILHHTGLIDLWSDDRISAGADWKEEISHAMERASVAILFITANFLNSEFLDFH